jgi:uncharacterized protein (TIGR03083 family)
VREVAAHVISSPQANVRDVAVGMVRARGNFNRCIHDEGVRLGARPVEQIVADYRRLAGSRRHPPGTTAIDPLLDVLVHTQDVVVPLGRAHPMPPAAARVAADHVWRRSFPFRARKRLGGFRFNATDVAWTVGEGEPVDGPIEAMLLLLTGRAGRRAAAHWRRRQPAAPLSLALPLWVTLSVLWHRRCRPLRDEARVGIAVR